jgi:hypothetical protein
MSTRQPSNGTHGTHGTLQRAIRAIGQVGRVLAGRQFAGPNVTVFPDDVFLVSYPRSGNTWTRFLIGNLIDQDEPVTFAYIESRIPEIYFNPDHRMRRLPRPRILKSHECFQPTIAKSCTLCATPGTSLSRFTITTSKREISRTII